MRISLFGNLRISFEGRPVMAVNTNRLPASPRIPPKLTRRPGSCNFWKRRPQGQQEHHFPVRLLPGREYGVVQWWTLLDAWRASHLFWPGKIVAHRVSDYDITCAKRLAFSLCVAAKQDQKGMVFSAYDLVTRQSRELTKVEHAVDYDLFPDRSRFAVHINDSGTSQIRIVRFTGVTEGEFTVLSGITTINSSADGKGLYLAGTPQPGVSSLFYTDLPGQVRLLWQEKGSFGFGIELPPMDATCPSRESPQRATPGCSKISRRYRSRNTDLDRTSWSTGSKCRWEWPMWHCFTAGQKKLRVRATVLCAGESRVASNHSKRFAG